MASIRQPRLRSRWELLDGYLAVLFAGAWLAVLVVAIIFEAVGKPEPQTLLFIEGYSGDRDVM